MSSKLDQSLEEIAGTRRNDTRRPRRGDKPRVSTGGVTKNTAAPKNAGRQPRAATAAAAIVGAALPATGESKIIVSNLVRRSTFSIDTHPLMQSAFRCHGAAD
jgi:THO complex subunit 4